MAISGVNFGAVSVAPSNNKHAKKEVGVKTVANMVAVPVAVGVGYAAKLYYEHKGKASVYSDMIKKYPMEDVFQSCLDLTKKSQRNAKIGAVALLVAGAATVLGYAGAKMLGVFDKSQTSVKSAKPAKTSQVEVKEAKPEIAKTK